MKNIQTVSKLTARDLNYDEKEVERVNDFFWKEVRRKLSTLESTSITIKHIGTITVSKRKIDQYIKNIIKKIRSIRVSTKYKQSTQALLLDVNMDRLKKALVQRNILAKQYYETYAKRSERIFRVSTNDSKELEKSTGRYDQPSEAGVGHAS